MQDKTDPCNVRAIDFLLRERFKSLGGWYSGVEQRIQMIAEHLPSIGLRDEDYRALSEISDEIIKKSEQLRAVVQQQEKVETKGLTRLEELLEDMTERQFKALCFAVLDTQEKKRAVSAE